MSPNTTLVTFTTFFGAFAEIVDEIKAHFILERVDLTVISEDPHNNERFWGAFLETIPECERFCVEVIAALYLGNTEPQHILEWLYDTDLTLLDLTVNGVPFALKKDQGRWDESHSLPWLVPYAAQEESGPGPLKSKTAV